MKLALDTAEALKDVLWFLSGDILDLSLVFFFRFAKLSCLDEWTGTKCLLSTSFKCQLL